MDYLFSPWRYRYISGQHAATKEPGGCVLCAKLVEHDDVNNLILFRGQENAVILNLFPYTSGHLMILPLAHVARLAECSMAARTEMMELATRAEDALQQEYRPDGINLGMNLGSAAGAGIAGHLHLHVLPRWIADANFMTVIGETRVLPEVLSRSYERLQPYFQKS
ncbi:MAG: HIT family protein [Terriglobales bacterium]